MLPRLKILIMLAMMVAESLSNAPPGKKTNVSRNGTDFKTLRSLTDVLFDFTDGDVVQIQNSSFRWDQSISRFNSELMKELLKDGVRNMLISPLSAHTVILMLYYASKTVSSTHEDIAKALSLENDFEGGYLGNVKRVLDYFEMHDTGLKMANAMFLGSGVPTEKAFEEFLEFFFKSTPHSIDPRPDVALSQINNFVNDKTKGLIPKILSTIQANTQMVLVNAIYHKGLWKHPFTPIEEMKFTDFDGNTIDTEGMYLTEELRMAKSTALDATVLELPYQNKFGMYVVVPNENTPEALEQAVTGFSYDHVNALLKHYGERYLEVAMPKFELQDAQEMSLPLEKIGMEAAFDPYTGPDMSNMVKHYKGMRVSSILHKTKITVNELGSEGAAASAIAECTRASCQPTQLYVNKPFPFFIIDKEHGIIVFCGVVVDPSAQYVPGA